MFDNPRAALRFSLSPFSPQTLPYIVVPYVYHRGPGILKYNAGVVPSVFLNMEMNALGVL
jgi:hypothetical protein